MRHHQHRHDNPLRRHQTKGKGVPATNLTPTLTVFIFRHLLYPFHKLSLNERLMHINNIRIHKTLNKNQVGNKTTETPATLTKKNLHTAPSHAPHQQSISIRLCNRPGAALSCSNRQQNFFICACHQTTLLNTIITVPLKGVWSWWRWIENMW